jgi:hypothetical protein
MIQTEEEDFSINPTSLPFDTETCKALLPHQQVLHSLAFDSGNITDTSYVPVLNQTQLTFEKKHWSNFRGGVTQDDEACINNYFYKHIVKGKNLHPSSLDFALTHAQTLLVAHCNWSQFMAMEDCPSSEAHEELEKFILDQAWIRLDKYTGQSLDGSVKIEPVDVDMEAMVILD